MNSLKKNFQNFKKKPDVPIHLFMILLARFKMNGILNLAIQQLEIKKRKLENIKSSTQIYKTSLIQFELKILNNDYQDTRYRSYPWYDRILWFSFDWAKQPLVFFTFENFS